MIVVQVDGLAPRRGWGRPRVPATGSALSSSAYDHDAVPGPHVHRRSRRRHAREPRSRRGLPAGPEHPRRGALALGLLGDTLGGWEADHAEPRRRRAGAVARHVGAADHAAVLLRRRVRQLSGVECQPAQRRDDRGFLSTGLRAPAPRSILAVVWTAFEIGARIVVPSYPGVLHWGMAVFNPLWFAVEGGRISNMFPPNVCIAARCLPGRVALLLRPTLNRWLARRRPWKVVVAANSVAMTVFTWHMTAFVLAMTTRARHRRRAGGASERRVVARAPTVDRSCPARSSHC